MVVKMQVIGAAIAVVIHTNGGMAVFHNACISWPPINPAAPVTRTFIINIPLYRLEAMMVLVYSSIGFSRHSRVTNSFLFFR